MMQTICSVVEWPCVVQIDRLQTVVNTVYICLLWFVLFSWSALRYFMLHDDVIKCKHFPRYWPFVRGIHRSPVDSLHKGQWRGALMLYLICAWANGWANNRDTGYLKRQRAHYDVTVIYNFTHVIQGRFIGVGEIVPSDPNGYGWIDLYWCAILIAHQIVMAKHGGSCVPRAVSIFQESPLAGEPRERLFHIHSVHRYQLCAKYLYPSTLLWQINCCNL